MASDQAYHRLELLTGSEALGRLHRTRVILFGAGGVGSWCAEGLVRSGIGELTIVDSDLVCVTNINRQLQATRESVGKVKTTELAQRLRQINPHARIHAIQKSYDYKSCHEFDLNAYDYVIDAIDSLSSKVELIANAMTSRATLFSALGASCKLDPTRIRITSIWDSYGCRLGRFVRKRLRRRGATADFQCVWSDELLPGFDIESACGTGACVCPSGADSDDKDAIAHEWCSSKKQINGSAVHITATYGFMLSGLVMQDVVAGAARSSMSA
jgi:tRNA A37 threonylcarbamoyladenosine dehydratase